MIRRASRIFRGGCLAVALFLSSCGPRLFSFAPAHHASVSSESRLSQWPSPWEKGAYEVRITATKELLWEVTWETRVHETGKGITSVEIHETGHGQPWASREPMTWEKEMAFDIAPQLQFDSVQGTRWTNEGKLLSQLAIRTDPKRRLILYRDTAREKGKEFNAPWFSHTLPDELLFHWIRALNFEENPAGEYLLLVGPTRRFRMQAFVRGTETVMTPAGRFSCYRVELLFQLGPLELLPIKKFLVPTLTLWCLKEAPHYWIRYQGPVGGPGSPQVTIDLTQFEHGDRGRA